MLPQVNQILAFLTCPELHMMVDTTPAFKSTWEFLDRRVEDVMHLGKVKHEVQHLGSLYSTLKVEQTTAVVGRAVFSMLGNVVSSIFPPTAPVQPKQAEVQTHVDKQ
jgi:hypothetical protein